MKVGMVVSHFQPEFGGHEFYLCKELARMGHEITLYTSNRSRPEYGQKKYIIASDVEGFEVKRFHAAFEVGEIPLMQGLEKALKKDDLELIHAHEFFQICSLTAWRVAAKRGIPFVLTQHGSLKGLPIRRMRWVPYAVDRETIGRFVLRKADRIIALTQAGRHSLVLGGIPREKIEHIPTGVATDLYKPSNPSILSKYGVESNEKVVLFVGRLVENKGVHILLRAFYGVQKNVDAVKLVIVGGGELENNLRSVANRLGIERKTLFLGRFPQDKMPYIYSGAYVFALPTLYSEPFGIAATEALATGIPVIASNVGGLKEIVVHGEVGYLTTPGDYKMLENYLSRLLLDGNERNRVARNARKRALDVFSWDLIGRRVTALYQKTLEARA
jgi:1,4-alpha-glucan branching enzyme